MMSSLYNDMYMVAAPLMTSSRIRPTENGEALEPRRLLNTVHTIKAFFDFVVCLSNNEMAYFASADWGHLIITVILGYRLCLPLEGYPEYDPAQARQILDFGSYIDRLCKEPEGEAAGAGAGSSSSKKTDTWAAFRVVLRTLKAKYDKKMAAVAAKEGLTREKRGCPMFDGSLDDYITLWDGHGAPVDTSSYPTSQSATSGPLTEPVMEPTPDPADQPKPGSYHDLWATMTLGWGGDEVPNLDIGNVPLDYETMAG